MAQHILKRVASLRLRLASWSSTAWDGDRVP